jgi:carotenoid cleavage dioxygenase
MPLGGPASAIRWVGIDPCWVFHGLNAHRDGDTIVLRVLPMESAFSGEDDFLPPHLTEWRIGTGGDQLTFESEQISDHDMEMPTIDRRLTGRPSRHGWFLTHVHDEEYGFEPAGICHRDGRSGRETVWEPGVMERPGEALFVPTGTGEDEGWLLSYLYDRTVDRSSLGIFDAMAVADGPVARIHLPARVPYGFHGLWLDEELLA